MQMSEIVRRRFKPTIVLNTDGEGAVHALGSELGNQGILLNPTGAGAHVHVVERKIEEIKERTRGLLHTLVCRSWLFHSSYGWSFSASPVSI